MVSLFAAKEILLIFFVFLNLMDPISTSTLQSFEFTKTSWPWTISISDLINTNANHTNIENYTTPSGGGTESLTSLTWTSHTRPTLKQIEPSYSNENVNQNETSGSIGNSNQTGSSGSNGNSNQTGATTTSVIITTVATTTAATTMNPKYILFPQLENFGMYGDNFHDSNATVTIKDFVLTNFTLEDNDECNRSYPRFISRRLRGFHNITLITLKADDIWPQPKFLHNCLLDSSPCYPYLNISLPIDTTTVYFLLSFDTNRMNHTVQYIDFDVRYIVAKAPRKKDDNFKHSFISHLPYDS